MISVTTQRQSRQQQARGLANPPLLLRLLASGAVGATLPETPRTVALDSTRAERLPNFKKFHPD